MDRRDVSVGTDISRCSQRKHHTRTTRSSCIYTQVTVQMNTEMFLEGETKRNAHGRSRGIERKTKKKGNLVTGDIDTLRTVPPEMRLRKIGSAPGPEVSAFE